MSYIEMRCTCPRVWSGVIPPEKCYYCKTAAWLARPHSWTGAVFSVSTNVPEYVGRHRKVA